MKKAIILLLSVQFFVYLGFGIIIPVLPEVIVQHGWAEMHVGGLLTVYALASFFTAPLWGSLSDRIGRKPLILTGLIGFSLSFIIFALFVDYLPILYLSRIIGGLFSGALYTAVTGFIGDLSSDEDRNKYMGFMGMSIGLGFIFGPAIGGILGDISIATPFIASAILTASLCIYAYFVLVEPEKRKPNDKVRTIIPQGANILLQYRVRYLFVFSFLVTFMLAGVESTFQLFQMDRIDITTKQIGSLFMFSGFVDAAIQGGVVRRIKDGAETSWLIGAQIITAIGMILFTLTNSLVFAGFALCVFTAGNALARTCVVSLSSKESGGRYGTAAGLTYSMDNLGRILGPLFFTWVFTQQVNLGFYISSAIAILSIGLIFIFKASPQSLRHKEV